MTIAWTKISDSFKTFAKRTGIKILLQVENELLIAVLQHADVTLLISMNIMR